MRFMACSCTFLSSWPGLTGPSTSSFASVKTWMPGTRPRMTAIISLNPRHIELRLHPGAVTLEGAVLADRVGALEDPVLPGGEPREDFRFHGFGADKTQVGFHAGEAIGRKTGALLEEHAH